MNEQDWVTSDREILLESLWSQASNRQLRLFACACVRTVWHLLGDRPSRQAVTVAERYADGSATEEELAEAAAEAVNAIRGDASRAAWWSADRDAWQAARLTPPWVIGAATEAMGPTATTTQRHRLWALVRDIFGNIVRSRCASPDWTAWHGGTIQKISQTIYEERRFDDLPILADALEEAGCGDEPIMNHCRTPGPHARGCWVVDLLLNKT